MEKAHLRSQAHSWAAVWARWQRRAHAGDMDNKLASRPYASPHSRGTAAYPAGVSGTSNFWDTSLLVGPSQPREEATFTRMNAAYVAAQLARSVREGTWLRRDMQRFVSLETKGRLVGSALQPAKRHHAEVRRSFVVEGQ